MFLYHFGDSSIESLAVRRCFCKVLALGAVFFISDCSLQDGGGVTQRPSTATSQKSPTNPNIEDKESAQNHEMKLLKEAVKEPLSPENTEALLDEVGSNWLFGQGMGETAATVGTIVVFPPYALWVVANAALSLSGEQPLEVSKILPEESGKVWRTTYDEVTSVPGRTTAAFSGQEYRSEEVANEKIEAVLKKNSEQQRKRKEIEKVQHQKPWAGN